MLLTQLTIIHFFLLLLSCVFSIEISLRSPFRKQVSLLFTTIKQTRHVLLSSRISDHWKERVVPTYAGILFKGSSVLLCIFLSMLSPFFISQSLVSSFFVFCMSIQGLFLSIGILYAYIYIRQYGQ